MSALQRFASSCALLSAVLVTPAASQSWVRGLAGDPQAEDVVHVRALLDAPNGGSYAVGDRQESEGRPMRPLVQRLDADGGMVWAFELVPGDPSVSTRVNDAVATPGGDLVMCGEVEQGGATRPWLAEVDPVTGAVAWSLTQTELTGAFEALSPCTGGYVATGSVDRETEDVLVVMVDSSGAELWSRVLGAGGGDRGRRVVESSDGELVVLASAFGDKLALFTLGAGGSLLRARTYNLPGDQLGWGLAPAPAGDVWVASTINGGGSSVRYWAARIDPLGAIVHQARYLDPNQSALAELVGQPDGGCTLIGTNVTFAGNTLILLELEPNGDVERCVYDHLASLASVVEVEAARREASGALQVASTRKAYQALPEALLVRTKPNGTSCLEPSTLTTASSGAIAAGVGSPSSFSITGVSWQSGPALQAQAVDAFASVSCHGDCGGLPQNFCFGSHNSTGSVAWMVHQGSTSIAQNDLELVTWNTLPNQPAVFFYGANETPAPMALGDGLRCIAHPLFRLPATQSNGSGLASTALDHDAITNPAGAITAGSTWHFQCWYRDPASSGAGHNVSLGKTIVFCP